MFERKETGLTDCVELQPIIRGDERGRFVKTWNAPAFSALGINDMFVEQYYSVSSRDVLRGLHFQTPPHAGSKLVYCIAGHVLDAVVDLRKDSKTFGQYGVIELSSDKANMIYVPVGFAHGFLALSETATLVYNTNAVYAPDNDHGILWNSVNIPWPVDAPLLSPRDQGFLRFDDFKSPF